MREKEESALDFLAAHQDVDATIENLIPDVHMLDYGEDIIALCQKQPYRKNLEWFSTHQTGGSRTPRERFSMGLVSHYTNLVFKTAARIREMDPDYHPSCDELSGYAAFLAWNDPKISESSYDPVDTVEMSCRLASDKFCSSAWVLDYEDELIYTDSPKRLKDTEEFLPEAVGKDKKKKAAPTFLVKNAKGMSRDRIITAVMEHVFEKDKDRKLSVQQLDEKIVTLTRENLKFYDMGSISELPASRLAQIFCHRYHFSNMNISGVDDILSATLPSVYIDQDVIDQVPEGMKATFAQYEGLYLECSPRIIGALLPDYDPGKMDTIAALLQNFESTSRDMICDDEDLVPLENGILDRFTKELVPYDPAYHFMGKGAGNWRPELLEKPATVYDIDTLLPATDDTPDDRRWDVDSWIDSYGQGDTLWRIFAAALTPLVRRGQFILMYDQFGSTGKSTILTAITDVVGARLAINIPIDKMSSEFALQPLIGKRLIFANETHGDLSSSDTLKQLVTRERISVNRKNKSIIDIVPQALVIQASNQILKFKSDGGMSRRLYAVNFTKRFVGEEENTALPDLLKLPEVLDYITTKALTLFGDMGKLPETKNTMALKKEILDSNDSVAEFWSEFHDRLAWDGVSYRFLYDLYKAWFADTHSNRGATVNMKEFKKRLAVCLMDDDDWSTPADRFRVYHMMDRPEPLIALYRLENWLNPKHRDWSSPEISCRPPVPEKIDGIRRIRTGSSASEKDSTSSTS